MNPPVDAASFVLPLEDAGGFALSSISIVRMLPLSVVFITVISFLGPRLTELLKSFLFSSFRLMVRLWIVPELLAIGKITWFYIVAKNSTARRIRSTVIGAST